MRVYCKYDFQYFSTRFCYITEYAKIKLERQSSEEPAVFARLELLLEQLFRLLLRRNFLGRVVQDIRRHNPLQVNV